MQHRRGLSQSTLLTNGPAKLVKAMSINYSLLGIDRTGDTLFITELDRTYFESDIVTTARIGITKGVDALLRFYLKRSNFVSKTG